MTVMCLNNEGWRNAEYGRLDHGPVTGDKDTVVQSFDMYNRHWYELERFPDEAWDANYFAILPEATADEMREAEHEAIIM